MAVATAIVRQQGEGEQLWFAGGGVFTMKATSDETGGAFFLLEDRMVRGKMTPLHIHPNEDDSVYVVQGELLVHIDGREYSVNEGGFFFAPRGVPHAFMVVSETAHILAWQTPGSGEVFYRAVSEPASSPADAARAPDFERLALVARDSESIEILGPPPFSIPEQKSVTTSQ